MKKFNLLTTIVALGLASASMAASHQGRIVEAAKCSQQKDAGFFTSKEQRALKCQRIKLPANDVCDAEVTNEGRPSKMKIIVPGLDEHSGTKRGSITFTKGGVIVYESSQRSGGFKKSKGFLSKNSVGDQLEFLLKPSSRGFELSKTVLYLDHKEKGDRLYWTEYTCNY